MKERTRYSNQKILHYSKEPLTHHRAIHKVAADLHISPLRVRRIVEAFFGKYGIKYFIKNRIEMNISRFGKVYFHKKSFNSYHLRKMKRNKRKHLEFMNKYNSKLK